MDNFTIGFIFLLLVILASKILNASANKKLDHDKKAELVDLFSKQQIYSLGFLIVIIMGYFSGFTFKLLNPQVMNVIYIVLIFGFIIVSGFLSYKKLKKNGFPDSYIKSYVTTTSIRFLGLTIFFVIIKL